MDGDERAGTNGTRGVCCDCDDTFRFRMLIWRNAPEPGGANTYRLGFQLVGSKTSNRAYSISFHTVDLEQSVHVLVPDYRIPIIESQEALRSDHPLISTLRQRHRVRTLVIMKPLEPRAAPADDE